ncbi:MAG: DbpA RNA binding domain-containing protein, partial [Lachnospiraceae bacterium]
KVNNSDYTAMDMAAAFLKMNLGMIQEEVSPVAEVNFGDTGAEEPGMVRLFINVGKNQKVGPGDILGALAGESGMPGKLIGSIDVFDKYTFVEVPREYAKDVLHAMQDAKIKGKSVAIEPANQRS